MRDPDNPTKYDGILVSKEGYRNMITRAEKNKKDPGTVLQQGAIDLVFTKTELASCSGLGLRKEKKMDQDKKPLDSLKVQAVMGKLSNR